MGISVEELIEPRSELKLRGLLEVLAVVSCVDRSVGLADSALELMTDSTGE